MSSKVLLLVLALISFVLSLDDTNGNQLTDAEYRNLLKAIDGMKAVRKHKVHCEKCFKVAPLGLHCHSEYWINMKDTKEHLSFIERMSSESDSTKRAVYEARMGISKGGNQEDMISKFGLQDMKSIDGFVEYITQIPQSPFKRQRVSLNVK